MKQGTLFSRVAGPHLIAVLVGLGVVAIARSAGERSPGAFLAAAVFTLSSVAIASGVAARRLAGSLEAIASDTSLIARGHSDRVNPTGTVETRRVCEAINRMADELAGVIEELRTETDLREQILASMGEGVMLAGATGDLVYCNQAAAAMFGRKTMELMPVQLKGRGEHEFTIHHPQRLQLRSTSVRLEDGRTLAVIQDETQRKRVEMIRRDFVANASHELKTPVAGILITAETVQLAMNEDLDLARRFAGNLLREAQRLSALVQDLLDLARLEQGPTESSLVRLGPVVYQEVERLSGRIEDKGLKLELDLDEAIAVAGVSEDLELMVRNLVENAVAYTSQGSVQVALRDTGACYELTVGDTGVGIPSADLERIFERFYRVDRARSRHTGGTGLGLSIVRHVAEIHGGTVAVESELGHGSTFTVSLPYPPGPFEETTFSSGR